MMFNVRTDLAIEAAVLHNKTKEKMRRIQGVEVKTAKEESVTITRVEITNEQGERAVGKPRGNYITIDSPAIRDNDEQAFDLTGRLLARELKNILKLQKNASVLVEGLGNWNVTPDALGPKVVSELIVTRHLFELIPEKMDGVPHPVCALSPGVLGITGIETGEIIKGVVNMVKPDLVIAIDALASRRTDRISTTIQIADTGITPGSGIGNKRQGLTQEYLGVPVIAIGVPTVVDAATVANDAIELLMENICAHADPESALYKLADTFDMEQRYPLIKEVLNPYVGNLIVTPKEVDGIIEEVSKIIANGINDAVLGDPPLDPSRRPF